MAIVQVDDEYVGLVCVEMPETRFEDILRAPVHSHESWVPIDRYFLATCEPGTVEVISVIADVPTVLTAVRTGLDMIRITVAENHPLPSTVTIRLSGIRRGHAQRRFQRFDRDTKLANDEFWRKPFLCEGAKDG